ncbi:MAG: hypothetical protein AAB074_11690 [Planctomycetota bacterium]
MGRLLDMLFDRETTRLLPGERAVLLTMLAGDETLLRAVRDETSMSVHFRHREGRSAYEAPLFDHSDLVSSLEPFIRSLRRPMESEPLIARDRRTGRLLEFRLSFEPRILHVAPSCLKGRTLDGSRWPWDFEPELPPAAPGKYVKLVGPDIARNPGPDDIARLAAWLELQTVDFEGVRQGMTQYDPAEPSRLRACEARIGAPAFGLLRRFLEVCDGLGWLDVESFGAEDICKGDGEDVVIGSYDRDFQEKSRVVLRAGPGGGVFGSCGREWVRIGESVEDLWRTVVLAKHQATGAPVALRAFLPC